METKPEPVSVIALEDEPEAADAGLTDVRTGTGLGFMSSEIVKATVLDEAPPSFCGFVTPTCAVDAEARSEAERFIWRLPEETYRVARSVPFQVISEPGTKLEPVAVRTMPGLPAVTEEGEIELSSGAACVWPVLEGVELVPQPMVSTAEPNNTSRTDRWPKLFMRTLGNKE